MNRKLQIFLLRFNSSYLEPVGRPASLVTVFMKPLNPKALHAGRQEVTSHRWTELCTVATSVSNIPAFGSGMIRTCKRCQSCFFSFCLYFVSAARSDQNIRHLKIRSEHFDKLQVVVSFDCFQFGPRSFSRGKKKDFPRSEMQSHL